MARLHPQGKEGKEESLGSPEPVLAKVRFIRPRKPGLTDPIPEEPGRSITDKR